MAHINLLPWRERLREERKREFFSILIGVVIIAGGLIFLVHTYYIREINTQTARNDFLQTEIQILDERVSEITQLRQQKEDIRARMNVITDVQGTRPVIVRVFDEMVKTLPDGVYYETLTRTGDTIAIEGVAESYARITELLRNLDDSEWFRDSDLFDIAAVADGNRATDAFSFSLTLTLQLPDQQEEV